MGTSGGGRMAARPSHGPDGGSGEATAFEDVEGGRRSREVEAGPPIKTGGPIFYIFVPQLTERLLM